VDTGVLDAARAALGQGGTLLSLEDAESQVPAKRGLYAVHADAAVWIELGLGAPPDERPLYVGKAESSLRDRDIRTHFGDGRTGSSTLRRSFAALLRAPLDLHAQPRNIAKPERFSNYGLPAEDDKRLTAWMRMNLHLAVWTTADAAVQLGNIEVQLLNEWFPPLNLKDCKTPWLSTIKAARAEMATGARKWADDHPAAGY
jgi:hypothetical protein